MTDWMVVGRNTGNGKTSTSSCCVRLCLITCQFAFICGNIGAGLLRPERGFELNCFTSISMGKNSGKRQKNHQGKKATKRRGWTTDDQFKYLNDLLPSFKTAQVSNTTHEMWAPIENQWFTQWPLPVLTEAESVNDFARRKKIMDVSTLFYTGIAVLTYSLTARQSLVR